jgi:hypothetical protein
MKKLLFFDISELGWVRYLSAHINYLKKQGNYIAICTNHSRHVFYRDIVDEILPMPDRYYQQFGHLQSDGNCLYNPNTDIIIDYKYIVSFFKGEFPDYEVIDKYSMFNGQRIFEPYKHSKESEIFCEKFKKVIIVFPRYRESKFARRNIKKENWIKVIETLCEKYPDIDILSIGGKSATYDINVDYKNYYNLIEEENVLDILVCLCNTGKVLSTFGTESGISLVATICKANTFMIGEGKERINRENFSNTIILCYQVKESDDGYIIEDFNDVINKFIKFTNLIISLKENHNI